MNIKDFSLALAKPQSTAPVWWAQI